MPTPNDQTVALQIKANADQAISKLKEVNAQLQQTGAAGKSTGTVAPALDAVEKSADKAASKLRDVNTELKKTGDAGKAVDAAAKSTDAVEKAATKATASANKLGTALGKAGGNLATGNVRGAAVSLGRAGVAAGVAGVAVTGLVAILGIAAFAFAKGAGEATAFNKALILTGGYAGRSTVQLQALAIGLDDLQGVTEHAAAGVLAQVVASGRFYGAQVDLVSKAALQMQQATGQAIDTTIKQFEQLGADPVDGILKLDSTLHFLTQSVYDQITALVQQGQTDEAAAVAQQAYAAAVDQRTQLVQRNVGLLVEAWGGLKNVAKEAWDAMLNIGRSDAGVQLRIWQQQLDAARRNLATPGVDDATLRIFMQQANTAQQQIDALSGKTADDAKKTSDALAAQRELAQGGLTAFQKYMQTVAHYTELYNKAIVGASDTAKAAALSALNVHIEAAQKAYDAATKGPKAPKPPKAPVDHSAEQLARQAASAQQAMTQALIAQQAALDPTAAAWAKYNKAVEDANGWAATMAKAAPDNVVAINSQRDAVIAGAAAARDAAIDKIAEKDRQAWEALKRSFETPAQVRVEDAIVQIGRLNEMLAKGVITAQQYHDALTQVGQKSVAGALPQYQGLDASVGGIGSELQKNYQAEAALTAAYEAQKLAMKQQFNDADEAQYAAHVAALNQLDANRSKQQQLIEQARGRLQLQTTSDIFSQLATLSTSHNKKIAAIGKAAAIADAIIKTYQAANDAYAAMSGIPYVGPALGVAAAAAAIAAGLANVAQIRSQNVTSGYAEGGYTGAGGKYQPAGIVHAGEVVFSQRDVARFGGVMAVETARLRGYAGGGFVSPLANAPSPAQLGFQSPAALPMGALARAAGSGNSAAAPQPVNVKTVLVMDREHMAAEILNTPTGTKLIVQHVGDNPNAIRGKWGQ